LVGRRRKCAAITAFLVRSGLGRLRQSEVVAMSRIARMNSQTKSHAIAADRHEATRGVMTAVVLGAVLWSALILALRWLVG
jgi:hypothetical protein